MRTWTIDRFFFSLLLLLKYVCNQNHDGTGKCTLLKVHTHSRNASDIFLYDEHTGTSNVEQDSPSIDRHVGFRREPDLNLRARPGFINSWNFLIFLHGHFLHRRWILWTLSGLWLVCCLIRLSHLRLFHSMWLVQTASECTVSLNNANTCIIRCGGIRKKNANYKSKFMRANYKVCATSGAASSTSVRFI